MLPRFVLLSLLACLLAPAARSQTDALPVNADIITRELDSLDQKRQQSKASAKSAVLSQLQTAAASGAAASQFYSAAVEQVQFDGQKGKMEAFIDWKKKNGDLLRGRQMQTALQLYLRYAALAMQRKGNDKPESLVPAVLKYVEDLVAADDVLQDNPPQEVRDLMNKPLGDSVMAKSIRLGEWLPDNDSFELQAGNLAGILEKDVRVPMRKLKDPVVLQTWDIQFKVEAGRVTNSRLDYKIAEYNNVTLPKLLFQRAQDLVLVGQPNRAVNEVLTLVRSHPEHPDFPTWMGF